MDADVVVVGAGFGGLATALTLAEAGARVVLFEALTYPGGCASTFTHHGWSFETGATLFAGFDEGQLMDRWLRRHALPVRVDRLDPVLSFRSSLLKVDVPAARDRFVGVFPGAEGFFDEARRVADALWALFDDPSLLPPFSAASLLRHAARVPAYAPLVRLVGRPLTDVLRRHRASDPALRLYLDALCQITVQTSAAEAEAPFALAATDYLFRGTGHVHGGVGVLAKALADTIVRLGGRVRFARRVNAVERDGAGWRVTARGETVTAPHVVLNVLPQAVTALTGVTSARLVRLAAGVERGWGAVMLYLGLSPDAPLRPEPHHVELVVDAERPLVEGNHCFCSVSGADEARGPGRTVTVSTHVAIGRNETSIPDIQARMREAVRLRAPELDAAVVQAFTASPRTWARFTRRAQGFVGGIPRRVGLHNYTELGPRALAPGLWMVGDTTFPGQSTLATALGGVRLATAVLAAS